MVVVGYRNEIDVPLPPEENPVLTSQCVWLVVRILNRVGWYILYYIAGTRKCFVQGKVYNALVLVKVRILLMVLPSLTGTTMIEEEEEVTIKRGVVAVEEVGVATTRKAPPLNKVGEPKISN